MLFNYGVRHSMKPVFKDEFCCDMAVFLLSTFILMITSYVFIKVL